MKETSRKHNIIIQLTSFALFIIFIACPSPCKAQNMLHQIDSLKHLLRNANGSRKVDLINKIAINYDCINNVKEALRWWNIDINESQKQKNIHEEEFAKMSKMNIYYNNDMRKEFFREYEQISNFFEKNGNINYFYSLWKSKLDFYTYAHEDSKAIEGARQFYDYAAAHRHNSGIAYAYDILGTAYYNLSDYKKAEYYLEMSIKLFEKGGDIQGTCDAYVDYVAVVQNIKNYKKLKTIALQWEKKMYSIKDKVHNEFCGIYFRYCYEALALAYLKTNNLKVGKMYLDKASTACNDNGNSISGHAILWDYAIYYQKIHNYEKALDYCNQYINFNKETEDVYGLLSSQELKAEILMDCGQKAEAADIYREMLKKEAKINIRQLEYQMSQLSSLAGMNELKNKEQNTKNMFHAAVTICVILIIFFFSILLHQRKLHHKNKILYESIIADLKKDDAPNNNWSTVIENKDTDPDKNKLTEMYKHMCEVIQNKELYKNADLQRDDMLEILATNKNTFSDMLHACTSANNFNEFINTYRLRHSARLLVDRQDLTISEICNKSGFNSRGPFNTSFRNKYGMTPTEYRRISKE